MERDDKQAEQAASRQDAPKACERCGSPEALNIGGRWFCESCFASRSSCCPELGPDDLWKDENR
jgi:hypothetical protein